MSNPRTRLLPLAGALALAAATFAPLAHAAEEVRLY
ncbi:iron ABC transporter substrate-binding protein, partial [Escherichia coli]|nr:iron ABC transporter substrate-binding protein [Escherichia coli]